jgi:GNAT superfamily N-acetyltransferase
MDLVENPGVTIHELGADREGSAAELFRRAFPHRIAEIDHWSEERATRRWAALDARGGFLAYGALWPVRDIRFRLDLVVAPDSRRHGIGDALLGHLTSRAHAAGATTLQARAESDAEEAHRFLVRRGFAETMRMHRLVLSVAEIDLAPFLGLEARLAVEGVRLVSLTDEQHNDRQCWEKLRDLFDAAQEGWPDPDPGPRESLTAEQFRPYAERFARSWEEVFVAKRGEIYLGFTGGVGTAVRPTHRNRGIATALKSRAVQSARERGVATMESASGNPAMLAVLEKMGFRRGSTEVRLVKKLLESNARSPITDRGTPLKLPCP